MARSKIAENNYSSKCAIKSKENDLIVLFLGAGFESNFNIIDFKGFFQKYLDNLSSSIENINKNDSDHLDWILKNEKFNHFKKFSLLRSFEYSYSKEAKLFRDNFNINSTDIFEKEPDLKKFIKFINEKESNYSIKIITTNLSNFIDDKIGMNDNILSLNKYSGDIFVCEEDFFEQDYINNIEKKFEDLEKSMKGYDDIYWFFYGYSFSDILILKKLKAIFSKEEFEKRIQLYMYNKEENKNYINYFENKIFPNIHVEYFEKNVKDSKDIFQKFLNDLENYKKLYRDKISNNIINDKKIEEEKNKKLIKEKNRKKDIDIIELSSIQDNSLKYKYFKEKLIELKKSFNWILFTEILRMVIFNFTNDNNWFKDFYEIISKEEKKILSITKISYIQKNLIMAFILKIENINDIDNKYFLNFFKIFLIRKNYIFLFDLKTINKLIYDDEIFEYILKYFMNKILNYKNEPNKDIFFRLKELSEKYFFINKNKIWEFIKKYIERNKNKIKNNINDFNQIYFISYGYFFEKFYIIFCYEFNKQIGKLNFKDYEWDNYNHDNLESIFESKKLKIYLKGSDNVTKENFWDSETRFSKEDFDENPKLYWNKILENKINIDCFFDRWLIEYILEKIKLNEKMIDKLLKNPNYKSNNIDSIFHVLLTPRYNYLEEYILKKIEKDINNLNCFWKNSILNILDVLKRKNKLEEKKYQRYFINFINNKDIDKELREKRIIETPNDYLNNSKKCKIINFLEKIYD